jgi:pyrroline-5-carboxylate reductase
MSSSSDTGSGATAEVAIIGGGNMGAALVGGMLAAGADPAGLAIVEALPARRVELMSMFDGVAVLDAVPRCRAAVIAVKPYDVATACREAVGAGAARVLSIAAGVRLATLQEACGPGVAVIRSMPNTPALVGQGASAVSAGVAANGADVEWAGAVLSSVGTVVEVPEAQLDAVTGLAGSGPAYLFLVAEALMDAGVAAGLPRTVSEQLVRQLLVGSAALLAEGRSPADLRAMVTSPAGTTAAGVTALEQAGVRAAFLAAVAAATSRSRELGAS